MNILYTERKIELDSLLLYDSGRNVPNIWKVEEAALMTFRRLQVSMQLMHRAADLGMDSLGGAAARPILQL